MVIKVTKNNISNPSYYRAECDTNKGLLIGDGADVESAIKAIIKVLTAKGFPARYEDYKIKYREL